MVLTKEEKMKKYLLLRHLIPNIVKRTIKKEDGEVIQGERSIEAQVADKFKRKTTDYDAYSPNPKRSALETERELDMAFEGDYFRIKPAQHKGTYKVISNINGETYADYTIPQEHISTTEIGENKYTTLKFELMKAIRTLRQKQYAYRHQKEKNKIKRVTSALKHQMTNPKNLKGIRLRWL